MEAAILDREIPSSVSDTHIGVSGLDVRVLRKGEGPPLLVVHDSLGNLGWVPFYERLASSFSVIVPDLPGYGKSDRPDWARSPRPRHPDAPVARPAGGGGRHGGGARFRRVRRG